MQCMTGAGSARTALQEESHLCTRWGADARPTLLGDREQRRRPLDPPDGPQNRLWTRQPGEQLKKDKLWILNGPSSFTHHRTLPNPGGVLWPEVWFLGLQCWPARSETGGLKISRYVYVFFCPLLLICPDTEHWHDGPGGLHWQHPVGPLRNPCVQVS